MAAAAMMTGREMRLDRVTFKALREDGIAGKRSFGMMRGHGEVVLRSSGKLSLTSWCSWHDSVIGLMGNRC